MFPPGGINMLFETLPTWIWIIYYAFLILTIVFAIYNIYKKRVIGLSVVTIVLSIVTPITHYFYSLGRGEGLNEFEHLLQGLQQGDLWGIFVTVLYLYILFWWGLALFNQFKKTSYYN